VNQGFPNYFRGLNKAAVFGRDVLKRPQTACAVNFTFKPQVFDRVSEDGARTAPVRGDTVMNAQEAAPGVDQEQGLPLPTAEMSGDDLFRLGMMYSSGQGGCPMDRVSAHMIFNLAAMKGSIEARVYRREMSQEMEQDEIAEAQKAARRWIDAGVVKLAA
jgi:hypothetical protein